MSEFLYPSMNWGEFNRIKFAIDQAIKKIQTSIPVKIVSVTNSGGIEAVGFVDVVPLINQIDGSGNPIEHETIYNIPYFRYQGGKNAIIIDPEVDDIGICVFASRDISKLKKTKKKSNPNSYRTYNFSDGMYIGGLLNDTPTQYIQFNSDGIKIYSPTKTKVESPTVEVSCQNANITASSQVKIDCSDIQAGGTHTLITDALIALFNAHTHTIPTGTSSPPVVPLTNSVATTKLKGG